MQKGLDIALWRGGLEVFVKGLGGGCGAAPLREIEDLQNPHAGQCDRDDVPRSDLTACRIDPRPVYPHPAAPGEFRSRTARPDKARMPQPFVDALAAGSGVQGDVQRRALVALFGAVFKLLLERSELGER